MKKGITKKSIISVLKQEVEWCHKNPMNMPEHYREGFVDGLKQSIVLIKKMRLKSEQP